MLQVIKYYSGVILYTWSCDIILCLLIVYHYSYLLPYSYVLHSKSVPMSMYTIMHCHFWYHIQFGIVNCIDIELILMQLMLCTCSCSEVNMHAHYYYTAITVCLVMFGLKFHLYSIQCRHICIPVSYIYWHALVTTAHMSLSIYTP